MAEVQGFVVGFANSARCMVDMYADFVGAWVITCNYGICGLPPDNLTQLLKIVIYSAFTH